MNWLIAAVDDKVRPQATCNIDPNLCNADSVFAAGGMVHTLTNGLIFVTGAVAVFFIIIGGLKYVLAAGDPKSIQSAKNTVLYAVIGVVVAILAASIVNFVIFRVG
jgi:hypothetical protein